MERFNPARREFLKFVSKKTTGAVLSAPGIRKIPNGQSVENKNDIKRSEYCSLPGYTDIGFATYYDTLHCLGCSVNLQTANGDFLDDSVPTLASNSIGLNSIVQVTNLNTGDYAFATVNDHGGFGGRIVADLNLETAREINFDFYNGLTPVQIVVVDCRY